MSGHFLIRVFYGAEMKNILFLAMLFVLLTNTSCDVHESPLANLDNIGAEYFVHFPAVYLEKSMSKSHSSVFFVPAGYKLKLLSGPIFQGGMEVYKFEVIEDSFKCIPPEYIRERSSFGVVGDVGYLNDVQVSMGLFRANKSKKGGSLTTYNIAYLGLYDILTNNILYYREEDNTSLVEEGTLNVGERVAVVSYKQFRGEGEICLEVIKIPADLVGQKMMREIANGEPTKYLVRANDLEKSSERLGEDLLLKESEPKKSTEYYMIEHRQNRSRIYDESMNSKFYGVHLTTGIIVEFTGKTKILGEEEYYQAVIKRNLADQFLEEKDLIERALEEAWSRKAIEEVVAGKIIWISKADVYHQFVEKTW